MSHEKIVTVRQLVNAFGGAKSVGQWLGVSQSAVLNWIAAEVIPNGWHLIIDRGCVDLGLVVDDCVFGLSHRPRPPTLPRERRVA